MRALSARQATRCETARRPGCRCRCGGRLHGAARLGGADPSGDQGPEQAGPLPTLEVLFALPADDPHHLPTPAERQAARRLSRANRALAERTAP